MKSLKLGLTALGLALAGTAALGATAQAATGPNPPNVEEAGFQATSPASSTAPWHFRYAQEQVTLPDVTGNVDKAAFPGYGVSVRLTNKTGSAVLGVSTTPSSGSYSPAFVYEQATAGAPVSTGCADLNSKFIAPGDTVVLAVYFDGKHLAANVADKTTPADSFAFTCTDPVPNDSFTSVQLGTEFGVTPWGAASPAACTGSHRLASFSNTVITNRTGVRGSAGSGPWAIQKLTVAHTSVGAPWGSYKAAPDNVVRPGRNFSVSLGG